MSTRDMESVVNDSFKLFGTQLSGSSGYAKIGHFMPLIAEYQSGITQEYGSVWPHCGPLLIVNDNDQSWVDPCNIEFTYDYAVLSGYITGRSQEEQYDEEVYITGGTVTHATHSIATGTRRFSQHLFNDNVRVYNVRDIEISDPVQDLKFYILADDGMRLLYGVNSENERNILDKAIRAWYASPPKCILCQGSGIYQGVVCPQCDGLKYVGYNAEGWLLERQGKEVDVKKVDETEQSFQHRIWARKQWVMPNEEGIKEYISLVGGIDKNSIEVVASTGLRELKFYVRFPISQDASDTVLESVDMLQELIEDIAPAGTNAILDPYIYIVDDSVMDYSPSGYVVDHVVGYQPRFGWYTPFTTSTKMTGLVSGWIGSGYNDTGIQLSGHIYGLRFFNGESFFEEQDFYTGLSLLDYKEIIKYDNAWVLTGETGWATGEYGVYLTGTTGLYR